MIGAKVIIFVFFLLCFSYFAPELVDKIFGPFTSRKPGWNFSYEPKVKLVPVTGPARSTRVMWRGPKTEPNKCNNTQKILLGQCHLILRSISKKKRSVFILKLWREIGPGLAESHRRGNYWIRLSYDVRNYAHPGGLCRSRPSPRRKKLSLLDLHSSSHHTQPHSKTESFRF